MEINESIIDKLADLSGLSFDATQKKKLMTDLHNMLAFVEKLNEVNTDGVEPLLHMSVNINELREDEVSEMLSADKALANAPIRDESYFKVPKVINKSH